MPKHTPPISYLLYARKSTESEDRQVASIDSQIRELRTIADREGLKIVDTLSESQSAKAPGRPVFNTLLNRVHKGDANGILCWKLDRLARNPVDGGNISWMLQQGILQQIQTHERAYHPTDNVLMMSVEFGMANQYIRDLSVNVKRGLTAKVKQGWMPGPAKPGYLNDRMSDQGEKRIIKDRKRFPLIKKAFALLLAGTHTPSQVLDILNNEWGYRAPKRKKSGGGPMSRTTFYDMLTDPFYYGIFEYPKGSGNWYQGKHKPMITEQEYWRIQRFLGAAGRPRNKKRAFIYTGLMHCGECTAAITAEAKEHIICVACKRKFSAITKTACPKCGTPIAEMRRPTRRSYEYYHCTKRKDPTCTQSALEIRQLESQIAELLATITISENLKDWYLEQFSRKAEQDKHDRAPIQQSLQEAYDACQKRLENLLALKISPQNSRGQLLSDEEFARHRTVLTREMNQIQEKMENTPASQWMDNCVKTFTFACNAAQCFPKGAPSTKRAILSALGSNPTIEDKKLRISLHKHFLFMQRVRSHHYPQNPMFEPRKFPQEKAQTAQNMSGLCPFLGDRDDVRTLFANLTQSPIYIPDLQPST